MKTELLCFNWGNTYMSFLRISAAWFASVIGDPLRLSSSWVRTLFLSSLQTKDFSRILFFARRILFSQSISEVRSERVVICVKLSELGPIVLQGELEDSVWSGCFSASKEEK